MKHKETHQGATLQKKMLLVETVEPWRRVLCCSEAPWELVEKQLPPEDSNAKTMGRTFADSRNPTDHCKEDTIEPNE